MRNIFAPAALAAALLVAPAAYALPSGADSGGASISGAASDRSDPPSQRPLDTLTTGSIDTTDGQSYGLSVPAGTKVPLPFGNQYQGQEPNSDR